MKHLLKIEVYLQTNLSSMFLEFPPFSQHALLSVKRSMETKDVLRIKDHMETTIWAQFLQILSYYNLQFWANNGQFCLEWLIYSWKGICYLYFSTGKIFLTTYNRLEALDFRQLLVILPYYSLAFSPKNGRFFRNEELYGNHPLSLSYYYSSNIASEWLSVLLEAYFWEFGAIWNASNFGNFGQFCLSIDIPFRQKLPISQEFILTT